MWIYWSVNGQRSPISMKLENIKNDFSELSQKNEIFGNIVVSTCLGARHIDSRFCNKKGAIDITQDPHPVGLLKIHTLGF